MSKSIHRDQLAAQLKALLDPDSMSDYCPNGLQVEGKSEISRVVTGVTASKALIEVAIQEKADAIFVHHGLMWKGDSQVITGWRKARLELLLKHGINVFAYHLPLDKHPTLGNNAQLGAILGWPSDCVVGGKGLIHMGSLANPSNVGELIRQIELELGNRCVAVGSANYDRRVSTVAWCTGGAPGYVEEAALAGADLYLTGELSEPAVHVAAEMGVALLGAGHHATERCGAQAVGHWMANEFGLQVSFHDLFVEV